MPANFQRLKQRTDILVQGQKSAAELGLGGMEYFEIYNAYGLAMGRNKLGELQASQDS